MTKAMGSALGIDKGKVYRICSSRTSSSPQRGSSYPKLPTAKAPERLRQRAEELGRKARAPCLVIAAGRKDQISRTGLDCGYFPSYQKRSSPRLARSPLHLLFHSNEPHHYHFVVSISLFLRKREKKRKNRPSFLCNTPQKS